MKHPYYLCGEDIYGEFIESFFGGTYNECVQHAKEILENCDGGHLDIYILHDNEDEFIGDVEV
jgi:hypothetical protein